MYPATLFGLFPPFPRNLKVFVAMSFNARFDHRWTHVLKPAIESIALNNQPLQAHRADSSLSGDSVLTQILDDIARCRLFVADITALGQLGHDDDNNDNKNNKNRYVVRNQNVFYEVGLAHAVRLPEEVLLFRSDDEPLAFDISNVRVHSYDPDGNPDGARAVVQDVIAGSIRELDLRKQLSIRRAAEGLDYESLFVLAEAQGLAGVRSPARRSVRDALSAGPRLDSISRLLEIGAIQSRFAHFTTLTLQSSEQVDAEELVRYHATPFGGALFDHVVEEMGLTTQEVGDELERRARLDDNAVAD
jgi:hypothetical protein